MTKLLLTLLFSTFAISSYAGDDHTHQDQIKVTGIGEIMMEPDLAILNIGINAEEVDLVTAKRVADERYQSVLSVLKNADIKEKDIKATRVTAQPIYDWQNSKRNYRGERVSRSLSITVYELEKVSQLMSALVDNGVSTIDGLSTGFKDKKALEQQALAAAADDAKIKATFLAERLGRNLGEAILILEVQEHQPGLYQRDFSMAAERTAMKSASTPPEMFGEQKITAKVNVSFNLL